MLYGKETLILEVTSTLLSNEIKKAKSRGADWIGFDGHGKERKRRKERSGLVKGVSLLSHGRLLKE